MDKRIVIITAIILLVAGIGIGYGISKIGNKSDLSVAGNMTQGNSQGMRLGAGRGNNRNGQGGVFQEGQINRGNCLSDDCLVVDNLEYPAGELTAEVKTALNAAIDDEYKAMSTYQAVIEKFGQVRPFSMIIGAENQHIASLKAIYDKYGIEVPQNNWVGKINAPNTLKEACQTGVDAEIANADLYKNKLLPSVTDYDDITHVFTSLMNASEEKHLTAFERCN